LQSLKEGGWSANILNILYKDVRFKALALEFYFFFLEIKGKGI